MERLEFLSTPPIRRCTDHLSLSAQATLSKHLPKLSTKRLLQNSSLSTSFKTHCSDIGVLTDICTKDNLPEVEIFSLLEEQIPKYTIRSDELTNFTGYSNQDWFIPSPALKVPCDGLGLTKEQTRETLNYFLLCGNRVSQMTRAYDDIDAVTRLLEEKEKDLELTVQIGKELLNQNNTLERRVTELENELRISNDDRSQLLHELHKKNELIAVLTNEDGSETDTPTLSKSITFDILQKQITTLQDENKTLKQETSQLVRETDDVEEQERKLLEDLTAQLNNSSSQYESLNLELERYREENRLQHEQIVSLTARLYEAEMRLHQLTSDNDEHLTLLNITKENQNSLALELVEFKQRYQEVCSLLQEAQEQLRLQRKRFMPQVRTSYTTCLNVTSNNCFLPESLQSELMGVSMFSNNSIDSGIVGDHNPNKNLVAISHGNDGAASLLSYKRAFDTIHYANKIGNWNNEMSSVQSVYGVVPRMCAGTVATGSYGVVDGEKHSIESLISSDFEESYPSHPFGIPGAPGAKDLEQALKRLTPAEISIRRAMLTNGLESSFDENKIYKATKTDLLIGLRTPDSIMSTESTNISQQTSSTSQHWRLPEKLQIVKPLEGSQTLNHWSRLATPSMEGVLEDRPGVAIRRGRNIEDLSMQFYTLSDVEEDVVYEDLPGKQFDNAGCTYTYTTSLVMHPAEDGLLNDLSFLSQSQISSRMASTSTSRQPSCPPTPRTGLSRKNSCSTFSVNLGLASMLNERGIKAVTPSAINTPAGQNFTPTITPCNSPEFSPTRSISPEPLFSGLFSGANLLRRKIIGVSSKRIARTQENMNQQIMLSRLERRALRSLKLVEKVESIGLENIIAASNSSSSSAASDASSRGILDRSISPLRNIKQLQSNENIKVDDLLFDRRQIKVVLHKGLVIDNKGIEENCGTNVVLVPSETLNTVLLSNTTIPSGLEASSDGSSPSLTDTRLKQMQRQKSRRQMKSGLATTQRNDLGTIGSISNIRNDLGKVVQNMSNTPQKLESTNIKKDELQQNSQQSITQSFVGSVSSLIFGRKGGWL